MIEAPINIKNIAQKWVSQTNKTQPAVHLTSPVIKKAELRD